MNKYYYDLHVHSCLSPCGDDDNTPNNLAGMAAVCGLQIMALTDHNTCKNCPAFFAAAKKNGIIAVAGMELTTAEDVHVICLFEELSDAMRFSDEIEARRIKIENRKDIFGNQFIMDENDEVIGEEQYLLSNATTVSVDDVKELVESFQGICYPAHIDREANGIISVLGMLPETPVFECVEFHSAQKIGEYEERFGVKDKVKVISSDAHYLGDVNENENYFVLEDEPYSSARVRAELFKVLRGQK